MTTQLSRLEDVNLDPARVIMASYLARFPEHTRDSYGLALRQWFAWCNEHQVRPMQAERGHVDIYIRYLLEVKNNMASTVSGKLNAINGFYRCALIDHHIRENPVQFVRRPSVPPDSNREGMDREEFHAVLDVAEVTGDPQHLILVGFMGLLGMRVSEALSRDLSHLKRSGGSLVIWVDRAKGNKPGWAPVNQRLGWSLQAMLDMRGANGGPILRMTKGPRKGERMNRQAAASIVRQLCEQAGVTKHITPHSCRHTFFTMALDAGCSDRQIVNSLGLRSSRMIQRYDRNTDDLNSHVGWDVSVHVERARPRRVA